MNKPQTLFALIIATCNLISIVYMFGDLSEVSADATKKTRLTNSTGAQQA